MDQVDEPGPETDAIARRIIGAAIDVHRQLGPGFLESVYEEALCVELEHQALRFRRQVPVWIEYRGRRVGESRLDLLVEDAVIVELKAIERLAPIHTAIAISYLRATGKRLALLMNFNEEVLKNGIKRVAL